MFVKVVRDWSWEKAELGGAKGLRRLITPEFRVFGCRPPKEKRLLVLLMRSF